MSHRRSRTSIHSGLLLALACAAPASAAVLSSGTITIDGTETLTAATRVTRNGIASTFASQKPYPGPNACPGGTCFYRTVTVTPLNPMVTVTLTATDNNIFAVAYLDNFNPANLATNYLGDGGVSGSITFQVIVPAGHQLVVTFVNAAGLGSVVFQISDPSVLSATPAPPTAILLMAGLLAALAWYTVRKKRAILQ
jgi:hypothetical protein